MKKEYLNICLFVLHSWVKRNKEKDWLTIGVRRLCFSLTPLLVISVIQIGHKCWTRNNYVLRAPFLNGATPSQWFSPNFKSPPYWRYSEVAWAIKRWFYVPLFRHFTISASPQLFGTSKNPDKLNAEGLTWSPGAPPIDTFPPPFWVSLPEPRLCSWDREVAAQTQIMIIINWNQLSFGITFSISEDWNRNRKVDWNAFSLVIVTSCSKSKGKTTFKIKVKSTCAVFSCANRWTKWLLFFGSRLEKEPKDTTLESPSLREVVVCRARP